MMKEAGVEPKPIADKFYDKQYEGCLNKVLCSCFKSYMRARRNNNVMTEYIEYRYPYATKLEAKPFPLTLILDPLAKMVALYSLLNNFILIYTTYQITLEEYNVELARYKLVVMVQFVSLSSLYLISYSTVNYGLYFNGGKGANLRFENMSARKWFSIIFSLFFIAPIKFVLLEVFVAIKTVVVFFSVSIDLFFGSNSSPAIDGYMIDASIGVFNMDKSQIELFQK